MVCLLILLAVSLSLSFFFPCFLGPQPRHMEVPSLGVKLELQLLAYATAVATPDPSCICHLHHSSGQHQILNPLGEVRDQTGNFMDTSQIRFHCAMTGTPWQCLLWRKNYDCNEVQIIHSFFHKYALVLYLKVISNSRLSVFSYVTS